MGFFLCFYIDPTIISHSLDVFLLKPCLFHVSLSSLRRPKRWSFLQGWLKRAAFRRRLRNVVWNDRCICICLKAIGYFIEKTISYMKMFSFSLLIVVSCSFEATYLLLFSFVSPGCAFLVLVCLLYIFWLFLRAFWECCVTFLRLLVAANPCLMLFFLLIFLFKQTKPTKVKAFLVGKQRDHQAVVWWDRSVTCLLLTAKPSKVSWVTRQTFGPLGWSCTSS